MVDSTGHDIIVMMIVGQQMKINNLPILDPTIIPMKAESSTACNDNNFVISYQVSFAESLICRPGFQCMYV